MKTSVLRACSAVFRHHARRRRQGQVIPPANPTRTLVLTAAAQSAVSRRTLSGVYLVPHNGMRPAATETVTAVREADGAWRIVGYFVH